MTPDTPRKTIIAPHNALLALADGSLFWGWSMGVDGETTGEVIFNTSMTGYQEIMTDPSYAKQLVTMTYPHIGNTGITEEDNESAEVFAKGLIIRELPLQHSNWRARQNLSTFLKNNQVAGIYGIDTRHLTRSLASNGSQNACMVCGFDCDLTEEEQQDIAQKAITKAQHTSGLGGQDLAKEVTTKKPYSFNEGTWEIANGYRSAVPKRYKVVVYDFGVKRNILRLLTEEGMDLTVVPATTPAETVLAMQPDGVFLSNGPGDPEPCFYAIEAIRTFLQQGIPLFGICLGHQLLALALGAKTEKMKFGHHGANHPVQDLGSKQVYITAQNHGFVVQAETLPETLRVTHRSLFDDSIQGLEATHRPAFGFQGHPEASPGPQDIQPLFKKFSALIDKHLSSQ